MDPSRFTPIAEILVTSYLETGVYSKEFEDQHGSPPTVLSKSHHLRSVVQAAVNQTEGLQLGQRYVEFGRVEITQITTGERFVLQSARSLAVEQTMRQRDSLFDPAQYLKAAAKMLIYSFQPDGVELSIAGAIVRPGTQRLQAAGPPTFVGFWPYDVVAAEPFDQGDVQHVFSELGDVDMQEQDPTT